MTAATVRPDWLMGTAAAPDTGGVMENFYRAAQDGRLVLAVCVEHGHPLDFDQVRCDACGSAPRFADVATSGTVLAVITMHRIEPGLVIAMAPYPVIDIELDSGHRLYLAMADGDGPVPVAGDAVNLGWVTIGDQAIPRILNPRNRSN